MASVKLVATRSQPYPSRRGAPQNPLPGRGTRTSQVARCYPGDLHVLEGRLRLAIRTMRSPYERVPVTAAVAGPGPVSGPGLFDSEAADDTEKF